MSKGDKNHHPCWIWMQKSSPIKTWPLLHLKKCLKEGNLSLYYFTLQWTFVYKKHCIRKKDDFDKAWGRSASSTAILLTQPPHPPGGWCLSCPPATRLLPCQMWHVTVAADGLLARTYPHPNSLQTPPLNLTIWEHPTTSLAHLSCSFSLCSRQPQMTISEARICAQL